MDWVAIFDPALPILELVIRGTLIFLALTVLLRVAGQREAGSLALTDLLVVVLVAQAFAHAFAPDSASVTDGVVLATTILAWSVGIDALAYRFPGLRRVLKPRRKPLIEDGQPNRRVMRREFMLREELEAQLRLQGIKSIAEVEYAFLEPNGMISAFRKGGGQDPTPHPAQP